MNSQAEATGAGEPVRKDLSTRDLIRGLLGEQPLAVLCTQGGGQPYGSLIAYAAGPDLLSVAFATPRATRKYRLLSECQAVALVIDSRSTFPEDISRVEAITATGHAIELAHGPERDVWEGLLSQRHPQLASFFQDPANALFRIDVLRYQHVSRLRKVREWIPVREG